MRICAITSYLPYPLDTGDSLRIFTMLKALAARHNLVAACVLRAESGASDPQTLASQLPSGTTVLPFELAEYGGRMDTRSRLRRVRRAGRTVAPPQMFTPYSSELASFLKDESASFDLIVLIGEPAGLYLSAVAPGPRVVWDKANVLTASFALALRQSRTPKFRVHAAVNLIPSYFYERRTVSRVTAVWVTSAEERRRLDRWFGTQEATVIPTVSVSAENEPVETAAEGSDIVWLSSFGYPPNWDGLRRYVEESASDLSSRGMRLRVIGKGATQRQEEWLTTHPVVDFRGYQEDLRAACEGARGAVVPIWVGAGVKLKTLTLMQLGLPVAATTQAMEGIPHDCALTVSDDSADLTAALAAVSEERAKELRGRAEAFLATEASEDSMQRHVERAIETMS